MNLTYKYRLYPNRAQAAQLDFLLWQGRRIYNRALALQKGLHRRYGKKLSKYDLAKHLITKHRRRRPDTWGLLPYDTANFLIDRLDKAYAAAFRRWKAGVSKWGFPRFKGRRFFNSLEYRRQRFWEDESNPRKAWLKLTNFDPIAVRYHRSLPAGATIKKYIIKRENGQWYVCCQIELDDCIVHRPRGPRCIGIDLGVGKNNILATSEDEVIENIEALESSLEKLKYQQQRLDRQRRANNPDCFNADGTAIEGKRPTNVSNRMVEMYRQLSKTYRHIAQQRWYFWHTLTDRLTREYDVIAVEDIRPQFMIKNKKLARHASDAAWTTFHSMLEYKAQERGVELIWVNPAYTSQRCHQCGFTHPENRHGREFLCLRCGHEDHADCNGAKNVLYVGITGAVLSPTGETDDFSPVKPDSLRESQRQAL